jgi:hypothetical protein
VHYTSATGYRLTGTVGPQGELAMHVLAPPNASNAGSAPIDLIVNGTLFVGMMPNRVQGQFAIIKTASAMKARSPICHQASSPKIYPTTARGACIAKPRL